MFNSKNNSISKGNIVLEFEKKKLTKILLHSSI